MGYPMVKTAGSCDH